MDNALFHEILDDLTELATRDALRRRGTLSLSPETVAALESIIQPPVPDDERTSALAMIAQEAAACRRCELCSTRTQTVFSHGSPHAEVVFVGEAPGEQEDRRGVPFVGPAGQLLTDIIEKGMLLSRERDTYICNVLKCRPPGNRNPNPEEMKQCEPFLVRQLEIIKPRVIIALGGFAAKALLKTEDSVGKLRGRWHEYHGIPVRVTYHPAYLLRSPDEKRKTWDDIREVNKFLAGRTVTK